MKQKFDIRTSIGLTILGQLNNVYYFQFRNHRAFYPWNPSSEWNDWQQTTVLSANKVLFIWNGNKLDCEIIQFAHTNKISLIHMHILNNSVYIKSVYRNIFHWWSKTCTFLLPPKGQFQHRVFPSLWKQGTYSYLQGLNNERINSTFFILI